MTMKTKTEEDKGLKTIFGGDENLHEVLFNSGSDTIIVLDRDFKIIYANFNSAVLFHQPPDQLIGKYFTNLLTPESLNNFIYYYSRKQLETFIGERQIVRFGGRIIETETKETPILDEHKRIKGIIIHLKDITDIKSSEELLHLQSSALEATAIGIAITNDRGDIVWVNTSFTELTGYTANELLYKNMRILKSGKQDNAFYSEIWKTIQSGKVWHGELYNKRKDGRLYSEEQTITPVYDKTNNISHFIVTKINISKRKKMEEDLRQMNEELEQLVKKRTEQLADSEKMAALGQLVAGIAHEINNPIGIAYTAATYLKDQTEMMSLLFEKNELKKSHLTKYLQEIIQLSRSLETNLNRAGNLIRSFKQLAVDQSSEDKRTFRLKEYFDETITSLRPQLAGTKHHVSVNCPDSLQVSSYPGVFSQIITNLVMNSLTHGFEDKEDGRINIEANAIDDNLILSYSDNGRGIPKKHLKKIYDPFFSTKFGRGGSGLGMNIIYNLVKGKLNGDIDCISEQDKGVHFTITIPINKNE